MTIQEILAAVDRGDTVHWGNPGYIVTKDKASHQFYIKCLVTGSATPLFWKGQLAGDEADFFVPSHAHAT
jgi:uncharacterized protein YcsI (UPF0317 family)